MTRLNRTTLFVLLFALAMLFAALYARGAVSVWLSWLLVVVVLLALIVVVGTWLLEVAHQQDGDHR